MASIDKTRRRLTSEDNVLSASIDYNPEYGQHLRVRSDGPLSDDVIDSFDGATVEEASENYYGENTYVIGV